MIIRESPISKKSNPETNWPPKSPREALLSSPNGLKRLRQSRLEETSPTPSKRLRYGLDDVDGQEDGDEEEDEDEETLQLQLKAIQARLKLKKLRNARLKSSIAEGKDSTDGPESSGKTKALFDSNTHAAVQVPLSPKAQKPVQEAPESPRRVILGIDKGLRASDVSLKKPSTARGTTGHRQEAPISKPKSFSEKLAQARTEDRERQEKQERGKVSRSKGFGVANIKEVRRDEPRSRQESRLPAKSSLDVARKGGVSNSSTQKPSFKMPGAATGTIDPKSPSVDNAQAIREHGGLFDSYSGVQLSKRILDETTLSEALSGKTIMTIPKLLKDVTAPTYDPPDIETDYVVLGIIASKSSPHTHTPTQQVSSNADPDTARSKFMVVRLTDLHWEVDLFLFDTGFERFWKLTVGTVVAILNPAIMPPKPHLRDTGKFSLKLSSSEDTVLEVGTAQDLGFCGSLKRDGKACGQWINKKKTDFCDFHVNLAIEKTTSGRMEINGMTGMGLFGIGGGGAGSSTKSSRGGGGGWRGRGRGGGRGRHEGLKREGEYYDRSTGETAYIVPPEFGGSRSAKKLLDSEDYLQTGLSAKERSRKRLAEHEKERELARKLSQAGSGLGVEYMRMRNGDVEAAGDGTGAPAKAQDAKTLGLVGSSAACVTLSPVKGSRARDSGVTAQPMGWGGAFKPGMPETKRARKDEAKEKVLKRKTASLATSALLKTDRGAVGSKTAVAVSDDDDLDII